MAPSALGGSRHCRSQVGVRGTVSGHIVRKLVARTMTQQLSTAMETATDPAPVPRPLGRAHQEFVLTCATCLEGSPKRLTPRVLRILGTLLGHEDFYAPHLTNTLATWSPLAQSSCGGVQSAVGSASSSRGVCVQFLPKTDDSGTS